MIHSRASVPTPTELSSAPLRNRIRLILNAPVESVWQLVGDFSRYPEYSAAIERADVKQDGHGRWTEYVCHFKGQEGALGVSHREVVRWHEPNRGYASCAEEPNPFGLTNALTLVQLESGSGRTTMTWDQHYEAADLGASKEGFAQALADIAERLVRKFGGKVLEHYVEPSA